MCCMFPFLEHNLPGGRGRGVHSRNSWTSPGGGRGSCIQILDVKVRPKKTKITRCGTPANRCVKKGTCPAHVNLCVAFPKEQTDNHSYVIASQTFNVNDVAARNTGKFARGRCSPNTSRQVWHVAHRPLTPRASRPSLCAPCPRRAE